MTNRDVPAAGPALPTAPLPFTIREAGALDLAHIQAWLPEALGGTPAARLGIATDVATGAVAGVAAVRVFADRVGRFLLYVAPGFRRRGCGTALLDWIRETGGRARATAVWAARSYDVGATDRDAATARAFFQARNLSVVQEVVRHRAELSSALAVLEPVYQQSMRWPPDLQVATIVPAAGVNARRLADFAVRHVGGIPEAVELRLNGAGRAYSLVISMVVLIDNLIVGALLALKEGDVGFIETFGVDAQYRGGGLSLALMYRSAAVATALGIRTMEFERDTRDSDILQFAERIGATRTGCRQCWGFPQGGTVPNTEQARPNTGSAVPPAPRRRPPAGPYPNPGYARPRPDRCRRRWPA